MRAGTDLTRGEEEDFAWRLTWPNSNDRVSVEHSATTPPIRESARASQLRVAQMDPQGPLVFVKAFDDGGGNLWHPTAT